MIELDETSVCVSIASGWSTVILRVFFIYTYYGSIVLFKKIKKEKGKELANTRGYSNDKKKVHMAIPWIEHPSQKFFPRLPLRNRSLFYCLKLVSLFAPQYYAWNLCILYVNTCKIANWNRYPAVLHISKRYTCTKKWRTKWVIQREGGYEFSHNVNAKV